ncbi:hypothetical protein [Pseudomonas phage PS-1]|uniref:tail fiber protein n=1 Tax=Pseudomonas phage PS-1 TaxID=1573458 RepID=UPI00065C2BB0|nr:tail fiber protein [Pseudomonas phage PS-1]BAR92415.1 hypothetical protein [Pseudomonas phage PS-1]
MTFNTGNNVPSTDPRDLYDNAENLDKLVNGADPFYADRLGVLRESWAGMENSFTNAQEGRETAFELSQADKESRFQAFLVSSGYVSKGDYAAGVVLEERNEYVAVDAATTGTTAGLYRPGPGATLPLTLTGTWATDSASLVLLGDDVLRQELAGIGGAALVGYKADTVAGYLSKLDATRVPLSRFGLVGDDSDETALFKTALNFVNGTGATLVGDAGKTYRLTDFVQLTDANLDMNGSAIRFAHVGNKCNLQTKGRASVKNVQLIQSGTADGALGNAGQRLLFALDAHDCEFSNIRFSYTTFAHAPFNIIGKCSNIKVENITFDTGPWAMGLIAHWATVADSAAVDYSTDIAYAASVSNATTHPHNIDIVNLKGGAFNGAGTLVSLLFLSGCYNITADNVRCEQVNTLLTIYAGDYADEFAPTAEKAFICNNIRVSNPTCPQITGQKGVSISGNGTLTSRTTRCDVLIENPGLRTTTADALYGVFTERCRGVVVDGGTIQGFTNNFRLSTNTLGAELRGKMTLTEAVGAGIYSDSADQPNSNIVVGPGVHIHNNNTADGTASNQSGVYLSNTRATLIEAKFGNIGVAEKQVYSVFAASTCNDITLGAGCHTHSARGTSAYMGELAGSQFSMNLWDLGATSTTAFTTDVAGHVWSRPIGFGLRSTLLNTSATVPTTGTHKQGDEVLFRFSAASGFRGAVCTAAGTPGTWKTYGAISA